MPVYFSKNITLIKRFSSESVRLECELICKNKSSWPYLNAIYFELTNRINGWLISAKRKKEKVSSARDFESFEILKTKSTTKTDVSRKVNTMEYKWPWKYLWVSIGFSYCVRFSNVTVHGLHIFSTAHCVLQKSFMSSCCWTSPKPLRLIGTVCLQN